jgi:hypothetical protein
LPLYNLYNLYTLVTLLPSAFQVRSRCVSGGSGNKWELSQVRLYCSCIAVLAELHEPLSLPDLSLLDYCHWSRLEDLDRRAGFTLRTQFIITDKLQRNKIIKAVRHLARVRSG